MKEIEKDTKKYADILDSIPEPIIFVSSFDILKRPTVLVEKLANTTIIEEKTHKKISIAIRQGKHLWKNAKFELRNNKKDYISFRLQEKMIILYPPNDKCKYWLYVEKEKKDLRRDVENDK